jgi:hypothetical protein
MGVENFENRKKIKKMNKWKQFFGCGQKWA